MEHEHDHPRRDTTVYALRAVQRRAASMLAESDRVLTECVSGDADRQVIADHLHTIDREAESIRQVIGRIENP